MISRTIGLSRINKQLIMLFVDSALLVLILLASFSIRLGYWYFPEDDLIWVIFGAPVVASIIFVRFGLYRAKEKEADALKSIIPFNFNVKVTDSVAH